ncbi:MAG: DUF2791 family P-loop domain-containing protein [Anaerolineae bacterium]|nr:DUF2791 family P-loop domain-containing protein [Anaerolineae bacterium]
MQEEKLFVGRQTELRALNEDLERALQGNGSVIFLSGEAGSGKTALLNAFGRIAQEKHENLVIASGMCDAQTGVGDPYLPFREILNLLTGDVESKVKQGLITVENAGRLKRMLGLSAQIIVEHGPDLVGTFVPWGKLVAQVSVTMAKKVGWVQKVEDLSQSRKSFEEGIDQNQIYEQYVNVLKALAKNTPLIIMLDDLQWADSASIGLLFRLARRLEGSNILVIGAQRPDEVVAGRNHERHPLDKVLSEIKRYFGDVVIDLDKSNLESSRSFVDTYLDEFDNGLDDSFRATLCTHTGGNPLFTIELIHNLQERGDLERNANGQWIVGPSFSWADLPPRVDAVIEERLDRIDSILRESLIIASIEGQVFTAEMVANVRNLSARELVSELSGLLVKQHRLVDALGIDRVGRQRLSRYRFRHNLIQLYLYETTDDVERSYLHEDVGLALEALYGDQADQFAVALAHHFESAEIVDKALHYLRLAGINAASQFANDEALDYYSRALSYLDIEDNVGRFELLGMRETIYSLKGNHQLQALDLMELEHLANELDATDNGERRSEIATRRSRFAYITGDKNVAITAAQDAVEWAQSPNNLAQGELAWGTALNRSGNYNEAQLHLEASRDICVAHDLKSTQISCLINLGVVHNYKGEAELARQYYLQAIDLCNQYGGLRSRTRATLNLGVIDVHEGKLDQAAEHFEQAYKLFRTYGERRGESQARGNLGYARLRTGHYEQARHAFKEALRIQSEIGFRSAESSTLNNMGWTATDLGDYDEAYQLHNQARRIASEIGDRHHECGALVGLGFALIGQQRYEEASDILRKAAILRTELKQIALSREPLIGLAAALSYSDREEDRAEAHAIIEPMLPIFQIENEFGMVEDPLRLYVSCYDVLKNTNDERASTILGLTRDMILERAEQIEDVATRAFFLNNVVACQRILKIWERQREAYTESHLQAFQMEKTE